MRKAGLRSGFLIATELGAEWPERVVAEQTRATRRVVAQVEGETPEAFAARLRTLASRLFPVGAALVAVVLACNERTDQAAVEARRVIGRTLLGRMARPGGILVLAAGGRSGGRLRHSLSALAIDLAPEATADVTVRFGDEDTRPREGAIERASQRPVERAVARVA